MRANPRQSRFQPLRNAFRDCRSIRHSGAYTSHGPNQNPVPRERPFTLTGPLSRLILGWQDIVSAMVSLHTGCGDRRDCARNSPVSTQLVERVAPVGHGDDSVSIFDRSPRNRPRRCSSHDGPNRTPPSRSRTSPRRSSNSPTRVEAARSVRGTCTNGPYSFSERNRSVFSNVISPQSAAGERSRRRPERVVSSCVVRETQSVNPVSPAAPMTKTTRRSSRSSRRGAPAGPTASTICRLSRLRTYARWRTRRRLPREQGSSATDDAHRRANPAAVGSGTSAPTGKTRSLEGHR